MYDSKGLFREACMECSEQECPEFEKVEITPFCGYCGCPATKHKKRKITECINSTASDGAATAEPAVLERKSDEVLGENDTCAAAQEIVYKSPIESIETKKIESLIPELPVFSKSVQDALEKGDIGHSKLWDNFIMQTSAHYINCPLMTTSAAYGIVGKKMFEKYPSIEAEGRKPWSKFTKALSNKIRKDRYSNRSLDHLENKGFGNLQSMTVAENQPKRNYTTGKRTTSILLRTETALPSKTPSEIIEMQNKLSEEWKKPNPEKALLKFYLRETFSDRTLLLQQESSFDKILGIYPCFVSADYFLVEFSIMVGSSKMKELNNKVKEFFQKVKDKLDISHKYDDPLLAAWLTFESKSSIFQSKAIRYVPIIEVTDNYDEFETKVKSIPATQPPSAVAYLKDSEIADVAITFSGHFISGAPKNVMGILTILISIYYTMELNYPAQYVQAMGALGVYVLDHHYYRLCKKALRILEMLK